MVLFFSVQTGSKKYSHLFNTAKALLKQAESAESILLQKNFDSFFQNWEQETKSLALQAWKA
tara:strand:+ start:124 stop:309 length:186 start_codon:yes stop_codon:yes gene_type:complete